MIPVYVIHCTELPDRTAACKAHFVERGVSATFWRGMHGRTWGLDTRKEYDPGKRISPAHVGLNVGTWNLWQHIHLTTVSDGDYGSCRNGPDDAVIVLEDDVTLPNAFAAVVERLKSELNYHFRDWDLVFLGLAETQPHVWNKVTERIGPPDSRLCRLNDPFGTHAIMLRRRALPVLLDHMAVAERHLDQQLWQRVLSKELLKWCAVLPSIVTQRTFDYAGTGKPEWAASTPDTDKPTPIGGMSVAETTAVEDSGWASGRPSPELLAATVKLADPYPCIYRGEWLDDVGEVVGGGRTVPLADCGKLSRPCHIKATSLRVVVQEDQTEVLPCRTCTVRGAIEPRSADNRLALPEGHFNPSMIVWRGRTILATRDSWGHSKVALWELQNDAPDWTGTWAATPIVSLASDHPDAPRLEDPRLFVDAEDRLCCVFNLPDGYPPKWVRVGWVQFADDLQRIKHTKVLSSPFGNLYEKNWMPIVDKEGLHWVYGTKPDHVILNSSGLDEYSTPNRLPWVGGVIRGGATPVLVDTFGKAEFAGNGGRKVYYHFFHGCTKRLEGTVYTVGCVVFDAAPPYRVLRQTRVPIVWPDLPAADEDVVKRYVVWPGGAVAHAGAWHLSLGIDDCHCRIVRLPFAIVEELLTDVPETDAPVSLRDTPLAKGVQREDLPTGN